MCDQCVCVRCGARAVGALPDGTLLCLAHYEQVLAKLGMSTSPCRQCGDAEPDVLVPVAHGILLCSLCYARYQRIMRDATLREPDILARAHPELDKPDAVGERSLAEVYAAADAAGLWDAWL